MLDVTEYVPPTKRMSKEAREAVHDFWICLVSRECSVRGRKDVLSGKGKFGIFGSGKEVPQVALARSIRRGDYRAGYYRDQTLFFALDLMTVQQFFAQLYADPDRDVFSGGRQMNAHFATPFLDESGRWLDQTQMPLNSSADISSTTGQMARALGLALASKKYRELPQLASGSKFTRKGDEVTVCTIGDASTSEGAFWETVNAAAVMQVPLVVCVWDDGYGISVPRELQTAKNSISDALAGMESKPGSPGIDIHRVKAWDYPALRKTMKAAIEKSRKYHRPALIHVQECTQPIGHSTSGSHERYKSAERLQWEKDADGIERMAQWLIKKKYLTTAEVDKMRADAAEYVVKHKQIAWTELNHPIKAGHRTLLQYAEALTQAFPENKPVAKAARELKAMMQPELQEITALGRRMVLGLAGVSHPVKEKVKLWLERQYEKAARDYHTHLYAETGKKLDQVPIIPPVYSDASPNKRGFEVLNANFDKLFEKYPNLITFGEDTGKIGGVNQVMAGLQAKYGAERVFDTGIREWTIIGQAIGLAMRGWRPVAEIQYLDYLIYGLSPLSDDLATMRYRSDGMQVAPAIIRTRGHRLEGIWHTGSPMGMLLNAIRGMYLCVPRNMTQAAGMYNTLLQIDEPAIVIEVLNGYRLREVMPDNIGEFTVPLGVPEILRSGTDVTVVTYGPLVRMALQAADLLADLGISIEVIDIQTLLPFDLNQVIVSSLKKTNRILFLDEDVPGGASAYMMQQVLERQGGYRYLDSDPRTCTAKAHRSPYGSVGDYFTKPNVEDIVQAVYEIMHEFDPGKFKAIRI